MVFLGLPFRSPSDEELNRREREAEEKRRRAMVAEQKAANGQQSNSPKTGKKEKLKQVAAKADRALNKTADRAVYVSKKVNEGTEKVNFQSKRFANAADFLTIKPAELYDNRPDKLAPLDFNVADDRRQYGRRAGAIHDGLDATFNLSLSPGYTPKRKGGDPLIETFAIKNPKTNGRIDKNDPLYSMFSINGSSGAPRKKPRRKQNFWEL